MSGAGLAAVRLLPTMTLEQADAWCQANRMALVIGYRRTAPGERVPTFTAVPIDGPQNLPALLREQAL